MGWSNFIVIPKWKLIIEVPREVENLEDYYQIAIDNAIDEDNIGLGEHSEGEDIIDVENVPINKITIKDLAELHRRYDIIQSLSGMDYNKFFLFWLKKREIEFSIESEYGIDFGKYEKDGYIIVER